MYENFSNVSFKSFNLVLTIMLVALNIPTLSDMEHCIVYYKAFGKFLSNLYMSFNLKTTLYDIRNALFLLLL